MYFMDVLDLIGETPAAHGVFDQFTETRTTVYCSVRSVGYNEAYAARANGLNPVLVFALTDFADYHGEKICEYAGKRYRIVRTYRQNQGIELTVEEATIDADRT